MNVAFPFPAHWAPREYESQSCNCVGPQNGDPVCPCMMPGYLERKAGAVALDIMRRAATKPRVRVKAGRREVDA